MTGRKLCSNVKFRNFVFAVVTNDKVKVPVGIEMFIGRQVNGIHVFQKSVKSFKITIWWLIDC